MLHVTPSSRTSRSLLDAFEYVAFTTLRSYFAYLRARSSAASISASVVPTLAASGMCFLPQLHQSIEMRIGHIEYVTHMILLRIVGLDGVPPVSQPYTSILAQFHDGKNSLVSAMNVRRVVISRIHTECDPVELVRSHAKRILRIENGREAPPTPPPAPAPDPQSNLPCPQSRSTTGSAPP